MSLTCKRNIRVSIPDIVGLTKQINEIYKKKTGGIRTWELLCSLKLFVFYTIFIILLVSRPFTQSLFSHKSYADLLHRAPGPIPGKHLANIKH